MSLPHNKEKVDEKASLDDLKKERPVITNLEEFPGKQASLTVQELQERVRQLEAHVTQLKNIIAKGLEEKKGKCRPQRPFDFNKYNTRHVALKIAYLGWDYQGLAVQEDTDRTIEAALFEALHKTKLIESRETSNYHRCGRTDKGVSAFGQVISIDLRTNLIEGHGVKIREGGSASERTGDKEIEIKYCYILNKVLPPEIRVLAWCPVDQNFSARFNCLQRTYRYYFPRADLNIEAMREAGKKLHGEHDFRNLCKMDVGNGVLKYKRKILDTNIAQLDNRGDSYDLHELTVVGQAFLWHQIRCIVAVLFLVGQNKEKPEIVDQLLDVMNNPRKPQYTMASELPLVLFDCEYENFEWIYEAEYHEDNIRHLQELWTKHAIKTVMLRRMLQATEEVCSRKEEGKLGGASLHPKVPITSQADCLNPGHKPRTYRPLMQRDVCESLEERIEHYAKRRKLTVASNFQESEDS